MIHYYILDEQGQPQPATDIFAWSKWFDSADRIVAQDRVGKNQEILVSTVFLGLNHSFGIGPPLLYETMVFGSPEYRDYQHQHRTREEALEFHQHLLLLLKEGTDAPDSL